MKKPLFITDLDGTLLSNDSRLSPMTIELVNRAVGEGALFTVATARTPATISKILRGLDLRLPMAVLTGAVLWNPVTGEYSEPKFIAESTVREMLEIYGEAQLPAFIFTLRDDHIIHIYHIGELSDVERQFIEERKDSPYKRFHVPADGNSQLPEKLDNVLLFYAVQPTEKGRAVYERICDRKDLNPIFYHDIYGDELAVLEFFSPQASKALAAARIAAQTGADGIIAFGDNYNDLPLLRAADIGVAVGNAVEDVRKVADRVIGTNEESAVPKFILSLNRGVAAEAQSGR